jgi:citrate synthase
MLETEEAARRLGVKRGTLYAYVSRGLLPSHRSPDGRRSLFDLDDVERLARRARGGRRVETRLATVTTAITQLRDDGPAYRGRPAVGLAGSTSYEEVTDLLWRCGSDPDPGDRWAAPELGAIPDLSTADRLRWAVVMAGAGDPVRSDLRPEAVVRAARRLIASLVEVVRAPADADVEADVALAGAGEVALLVLESGGIREGSLAGRLAGGLSAGATPELVGAVNAALVLLADHELATSTLAVRVAASTRADLYDAVLAGLGTLGGPLHGGASRLAYSLLVDAERHGPRHALDEALRWQRWLPGFGQSVYPDGDPRATVLLERFAEVATEPRRRLVGALVDLAVAHDIPPPNVDLGLAAVCWAADLPPDAGRTIFTVARVSGWVAHYLEELTERPLRFRARAVYASNA